MKRHWAGKALLIVLGIVGFTVFAGLAVMYLWNWLMPTLFGLVTISFWQALGIFALAKILFGFGGGGDKMGGRNKGKWGRRFQEKWGNMSNEEREKYRRCGWGYTSEKADTVSPD